jgi:lysophospholipase L1-like esterase
LGGQAAVAGGLKKMKPMVYMAAVALLGYFLGAIAYHKKLFPFEQIARLAEILSPVPQGFEVPHPRNTIFASFSPAADVVMIGDSITNAAEWREMFPGVNIANRGVAGDKLDDILARMDTIFAVRPSRAFIMVGINDIFAGHDADQIFSDYLTVIKKLQEKNIAVFVQSTLECTRTIRGKRLDVVRRLNRKLKDCAVENQVQYIDINRDMVSEDEGLQGKYTYDGLHLLGVGYEAWQRTLQPYMKAAN